MKEILLGKSVEGRDIKGYAFGDENSFNKTIIIGAIHGVEPQSKEFCEFYINEIKDKQFPEDCFLLLIPCINPDGIFHKTRVNANEVDLNRNFPSHTWNKIPVIGNSAYCPGSEPASEPETKIIVDLIVLIHSIVVLIMLLRLPCCIYSKNFFIPLSLQNSLSSKDSKKYTFCLFLSLQYSFCFSISHKTTGQSFQLN